VQKRPVKSMEESSEGADKSKRFHPGKRVIASTALALSNSERALEARPSKRDGAAEHTGSSRNAGKKKCKIKKRYTSKNSTVVKRTRLSKPSTPTATVTTHTRRYEEHYWSILFDDQDFVQVWNCDALRSEEELPPRDATDDDIGISTGTAFGLPDVSPSPEAEPLQTTEDFTQDFLPNWNPDALKGRENLPPKDATDYEILAAVLAGNSANTSNRNDGLPHNKPDYFLNGYVQPPPISPESSSSSDSGPEASMGRYNIQTPDTDENYEFQKEWFDWHYQKIREEQMERQIDEFSNSDYD